MLVHSNPNGYGYIDEGKPEILPTPRSEGDILSSPHLKPFTLYDLKKATRNFQAQNLIGEGGFGNVYKGRINGSKSLGGTISGSGTDVAVKKLRPEGFQGHKEWLVGYFHRPLVLILLLFYMNQSIILLFVCSPKSIILANFTIRILSNLLDTAWKEITDF